MAKARKSNGAKDNEPNRNMAKGFPLPDWLRTPQLRGIRARKALQGKTKTPGAYKAGANGVYVFRLVDLKAAKPGGSAKLGTHYADTRAVVIEGKQMMVGLAHEKAGMGSQPHTHPNDQINLVLKGTLRCRIANGPEMLVPTGSLVYFPANVEHESGATADEDVIFYVCKDLAWSMEGIPSDGKARGPRTGIASAKAGPRRNART